MRKTILLLLLLLLAAGWLVATQVNIGSGTTYNSSTSYPAVYGGYYKNAREQYLITPQELNLAGGGAGNITSLAFNVQSVNSCGTLPAFTIRLGHSSQTVLTNTFVTGLTQVYTIGSYQPVVGLNTHVFSTPFNFNGTSSLIVEVTFNMQAAYTYNTSTYFTASPDYKALYYRSDGTAWNTVTTGTLSYNRPNLQFEMAASAPILPFAPILVSPANGSIYQSTSSTLNWASGGGGPLFYKIHFGTVNPPPLVSVVDAGTISYAPTLAPSTTYYWKIVPFNALGDAVSCPIWSFTTSPPGTVIIGNGSEYQPRLPINSYFGYSYTQVIYLADELGGPGQITSLAWYWNGATASANSNAWTIYLGHTLKSEFTSFTDWLPYDRLTQVFSGAVEMSAVPGWITVNLSTPFGYDGVHNLIVAVDENEPNYDSSSTGFYCTPTPAPRGLLYYSDSNNPDPSAPPAAYYMRNYLANLIVVSSPLPVLAPLSPVLMWPNNGEIGLPLAGFDLAWMPNLNGGGLPDSYGVYLSHDPDPAANTLHYAVTADMHYNPVSQGGLSFAFEEDWYWTVKAFKTGLPDSPTAAPQWFEIIGSPPEIAVDPVSLVQSQDHGLATTQTLAIINDGGLPLEYSMVFTNTSTGEPSLWCWCDPIQGSIPRHSQTPVIIHYDSSLLEPGIYTGYFTIAHNVPDSPTLEVSVQLTVTGEWPAEFVLQPTGHDFGEVEQLNPSTFQFSITNTGGSVPAPLIIPASGIFLAYQAEANFSLQAPGLPVSLSHGLSFDFHVTFTPQSVGAKSATLLIMDNLGRNIYTAPISGTGIAEDIGHIVNFQAAIQNNVDINLTWILAPGTPGDPGWLYYDSGSNSTAIGTGTAASYEVAIKFPVSSIAEYAGMQIKHIKYFPRSASTAYTLKIWTGNDASQAPSTVVYTQAVTPTANAWNDITLSTPYWITGTDALWVGYEAVVPSPSDNYYPLGCDAGPAVAGYGDLLYYSGFWASMFNFYGINSNWNIQAYVESATAKGAQAPPLSIPVVNEPLDLAWLHEHPLLISENVNPQERAVRGFNVFRDGVQINTELVPTATFTDFDRPNGTYVYTVQAVYYSAVSPLSDPATVVLEYYPPYDLPFVEDWESGSLATHHWQTAVPNWVPYTIGNPGFGLVFQYSPTQQNYGESAVSHLMNGIGFASVNLGFDMAMSNYSTGAENWMAAEVFDGSGWTTLATWSSFMNSGGGMPWTHFDYDISAFAAGHEFQIRFRAYGVNSWYINYWVIDNISLSGIPSGLAAPQVTISYDPITAMIHLEWDNVPDAVWYGIYTAPDPYGTFVLYNWVAAPVNYVDLPPVDKQFYEVTSGVGSPPDGSKVRKVNRK